MNLFEMTYNDLTRVLSEKFGKGEYHSKALYREVIKKGNFHFETAPEFLKSAKLAEKIQKEMIRSVPEIAEIQTEENTTKFICRFGDGKAAESVIIRMKHYNTLCVSSQIGCRMNCRFCETGRTGFQRNLRVSEITAQLFCARFLLKEPVHNIVFMGMGEPFDNFDNVVKAIAVLNDQRGFDIAHRHITVSTAGLPEGIRKFGETGPDKVNIAVSLNASENQTRSNLMPLNERHDIDSLINALKAYPLRKKGSFLIEYILIRGINDSEEDAERLSVLLEGLPVRFNLIPLNETTGFPAPGTTDEEIHIFAEMLEKKGLFIIKRWSRGRSLTAACGQLGRSWNYE